MSAEFDVVANREYLRKRFTEQIWNNGVVARGLDRVANEQEADRAVEDLVTTLLVEVGAFG